MARMWSARTSGYRLGVLFLFVASVFYVLGYSVPFWIVIRAGRAYQGLWFGCVVIFSQTHCRPIGGDTGDWFKAVQAMESVGVVGVVISCVYALVVNCCKVTHNHNRFLEVMTALSGLCGFIGCMVLVGKIESLWKEYLDWAFGINLTGSILLMIVAVIIYVSNRAQLAFPTTAGVIVWSGPAPVQGGSPATMIVQHPGQGYPGPQAGMMYVVAQPGHGYNPGQHPGAAAGQSGYTTPAAQVIPAAVPTQPVSTEATTQPVSSDLATPQPVSTGAQIQAVHAAAATQPVHASGPTQPVQAEVTTEAVMLRL